MTTADLTNAEVGDTLVLRCGGKVVVTSITDAKLFVHGWSYAENGKKSFGDNTDPFDCIELIKKPKPKTVEIDVWINVTKSGGLGIWRSRKQADEQEGCSPAIRIACIHLQRTVTEGEGLNDE